MCGSNGAGVGIFCVRNESISRKVGKSVWTNLYMKTSSKGHIDQLENLKAQSLKSKATSGFDSNPLCDGGCDCRLHDRGSE